MYKRRSKTNDSLLLQRLRTGDSASSGNSGKRQEGRPPVFILFQKFNQQLRRLLRIGNDILNAAAKRRLDRDLICLLDLDDIRYDTVNARHPFLLLHDTPDTVAIAIIAFRNVPQGFQAGCTAMIFRLLLLDRLIIAGQKLLFFTELFICLLALLSQCMNSTGDRFIFFFYLFDCLCLLRLLTAQTQCLLRHTGFINLRLLQHRRKPLHPCFDRCTVIQDLYDPALSLCHRLIQTGDLLLYRIQSLCSRLLFRIRLIQLQLPVTAF